MSLDSSFPHSDLPYLPPNTIVPNPVEETDVFIQYLNRLYEEIAFTVNQKDFSFFSIGISNVAQNIPNIENFGAFILCVSGESSDAPTKTVSLVKSSETVAGVVNILGTQVGTNAWAGNNIFVTSTATNFQIRHDRATPGNFNIKIIGTQ